MLGIRRRSGGAIKPERPLVPRRRRLVALLGFALAGSVATASCGDHEGKLEPAGSGGSGVGGARGDDAPASGNAPSGGSPSDNDGRQPSTAGASGVGGSATIAEPSGGAGPVAETCIYHLDVEASGGAGGAAGAGGSGELAGASGEGGAAASPTITKATNRLVGDYLADAAGRALYVFGADLAGDCEAPPLSACAADCPKSWPIFHVDSRVLAPGLDEAAFGSFIREDGVAQTTYYGWPLYYYANDAEPGDVTGHGSGVWGLAELILPNVVVRRVGMDRLLADGAGRTLYAFADDVVGSTTREPQSACVDACREQHPPFSPHYVGAISTLEPRDFASFVRDDGTTQVAYKGAPLYYSALDRRPGDVNGAEDQGFTIVLK